MELSHQNELFQTQRLNQAQIQFVEMLALTNEELAQMMKREYQENPLLESNLGAGYADHQTYVSGEERDRLINIPAPESEAEAIQHLVEEQLDLRQYSIQEQSLIAFYTACLDNSGFLTVDAATAAQHCRTSLQAAEVCLEKLKRLEPAGIFSSNLAECLLAQLRAAECEDQTLLTLVQDHLDDLMEGRLTESARALGISRGRLKGYLRQIAALEPRPLSGLGGSTASTVIPDVLCTWDGRHWCVTLNDGWYESYALCDTYVRLLRENSDPAVRDYLERKYVRAKLLLSGIANRRGMIVKILSAVVCWQQDYLLGTSSLCPMTMQQIGEVSRCSVSTVSRAIKGKYLQYPRGTILIKALFQGSAASTMDDRTVTADRIISCIKALVEEDISGQPASDSMLQAQLSQRFGIEISRRTVTKYREKAGISSSYRRL